MLNRPPHPIQRAALAVWRLPRLVLMGVVRFYQVAISPLTPPTCRYTPTCSEYALLALRQYGFVRGSLLAVWRILRCAPWGGHGHDPPRWFGEPKPPQPVTASGVRAETEAPPPAPPPPSP